MHTEIPAGLSSYPTKSGQLYRFAGILRGSTATEFTNALTIAGMALQTVSADTWPEENLPPLSDGETYVRGEGKWTNPSAMSTGFQLPGGSASIFQLWEFTPQALEKASVTVPTTTASAGHYGLGLGLVALGVFAAGALLIAQRKENPKSIEIYPTRSGFQALVTLPNGAVATFTRSTREEALKAARAALRNMPKANPLRYVRSVHYRGVPIHIHYDDVKDDYSVDFVVAGQHVHTSAGHFESTAVDLSKRKIDRVLGQLQPKSPKVYPSPWS